MDFSRQQFADFSQYANGFGHKVIAKSEDVKLLVICKSVAQNFAWIHLSNLEGRGHFNHYKTKFKTDSWYSINSLFRYKISSIANACCTEGFHESESSSRNRCHLTYFLGIHKPTHIHTGKHRDVIWMNELFASSLNLASSLESWYGSV